MFVLLRSPYETETSILTEEYLWYAFCASKNECKKIKITRTLISMCPTMNIKAVKKRTSDGAVYILVMIMFRKN